jgi:hypothetical protein
VKRLGRASLFFPAGPKYSRSSFLRKTFPKERAKKRSCAKMAKIARPEKLFWTASLMWGGFPQVEDNMGWAMSVMVVSFSTIHKYIMTDGNRKMAFPAKHPVVPTI